MKRSPTPPPNLALRMTLFLLTLFLFRLAFGLCSEFWADEERQIYLIGLKFYTTGQWPYFGPVANSEALIPGALQGLLVGVPLMIWHVPEAPYLLLNFLSFGALCLFSWYCAHHFPLIPRWFILTWLMLAPWTLSYSTFIVNPSYVLVGGILFFVGFLETCPFLSLGLLPPWLSNLFMGFSVFWILQLHLSGAILFPFVGLSLYFQFCKKKWKAFPSTLFGLVGAAMPLAFLVPTFLRYGLSGGMGGSQKVLEFHPENLQSFFTILARLFSFASFELLRFIGANTTDRLSFFHRNPWLFPFGIILLAAGYLQVLSLVIGWFKTRSSNPHWKAVKWTILGVFLFIYGSFLFTHKDPASHTYYVFLPIVMIYAFHCWEEWLEKERWQKFAKVFLVLVAIYQAGLAYDNFKEHSLYKDRDRIVQAIEKKDYRLAGDFYTDSWPMPQPLKP